MTAITWFFQLFRDGHCRIQTIPLGYEVFADDRVMHYQGDSVEEAVLQFLGWYLKDLKEQNLISTRG